jgi:aryl-alcohol dehydrogenase-like predicted oxidoreductase
VHAALDAGVMLIDTALAYTRAGVESYAEQIVARSLRGLTTGRPLVATKGGHWRRGDSFPVDGRPDTLRAHCEISLRNLEADRIDLYQLHHVDSQVPLPDSVGAERDIAYLAYSPAGGPARPIPQAALAVARRRGVSPQRVLLAWLRQQSPNIVPLAGASRPTSIRDSAGGLDLTDQDLQDLRVPEEQRTHP